MKGVFFSEQINVPDRIAWNTGCRHQACLLNTSETTILNSTPTTLSGIMFVVNLRVTSVKQIETFLQFTAQRSPINGEWSRVGRVAD